MWVAQFLSNPNNKYIHRYLITQQQPHLEENKTKMSVNLNQKESKRALKGLLILILLSLILLYLCSMFTFHTALIVSGAIILVRVIIWCYCYYCPTRAADVAFEDRHNSNNYLLTNGGYLYCSNIEDRCVEKIFMEKATPENITDIWMKYSPCILCSHKLKNYFCINREKPTIHLASIWREGNTDDEEGLRDLREDGFKLGKWGRLAKKMGKAEVVDCVLDKRNNKNSQCTIV